MAKSLTFTKLDINPLVNNFKFNYQKAKITGSSPLGHWIMRKK